MDDRRVAIDRCKEIIELSYKDIVYSDSVEIGYDRLIRGLSALRQVIDLDQWNSFCSDYCMRHVILKHLMECPFTRRCFLKPRGYAGDAVSIDFVYFHPSVAKYIEASSKVGRRLFNCITNASGCVSIRNRKRTVARHVDRIANKIKKPHILSLACGHMREIEESNAVAEDMIGMIVGYDIDIESLRIIQNYQTHCKCIVEAVQGDIRSIVLGKKNLGKFDFVYASGLFDYLDQRMGRKLTRCMFDMLNHGGELLIPNLTPENCEIGYIEAFMDWRMVYRGGGG
ncbi:extracellular factor (EF) 3-hydroxypalmitic acid methyl ester biosynthesis protein [Azospirillaceae bacterium]